MTVFALLAGCLALGAVALLVIPLLREHSTEAPSRRAAIVTAFAIPLLATVIYVQLSDWTWEERPTAAGEDDILAMVAQLSNRLAQQGGTVEEWQMLGRSRMALEQPELAAEAYRQAYRQSQPKPDVETVLGYAEALVAADPQALAADAGDLFERALELAPANPRALWYGGLAAFERGRFTQAERRFAALLESDPPPEVRAVLERQIAAARSAGGREAAPTAKAGEPDPAAVKVAISLSPELATQIPEDAALFVFARPLAGGGPPLAVVRRRAAELPLSLELSDADAMIAGRTLSSENEIEIVARVALSGTPTATSGDPFGSARHRLASNAPVQITIDRVFP